MSEMKKKEKCLRSLIDGSRLYDRAKIEDTFKELANDSLLSIQEKEEGLSLVKRLFTPDINNDSLLFEILNKRIPERVSEIFCLTLKKLDEEIPEEFKKCKSIYAIREQMLKFGFSSEDNIVDRAIEITFKSTSYSAKYRLTLENLTVPNVAKIAKLTLTNSYTFGFFSRSLF